MYLKDHICQDREITHVTVMPCYDKKLEAVRPMEVTEVDTVLATHELDDMLTAKGVEL